MMMVVVDASDRASAKYHVVLGQGAGLVGKHVLDLAEFFRNVQRSTFYSFVQFLIVELDVFVDEIHLAQFDDFNADVQRQWNQDLH